MSALYQDRAKELRGIEGRKCSVPTSKAPRPIVRATSTEASVQVIHTLAGHFPKHVPLGDRKPTPKPKKQTPFEQKWKGKVFTATNQDTRE